MIKIVKIINIITFITFFVFFMYSLYLGGDALNGLHAKDLYADYNINLFYVASHGKYFAVSFLQWIVSLILAISTIVLFIVSFVSNIIIQVKTKQTKKTI